MGELYNGRLKLTDYNSIHNKYCLNLKHRSFIEDEYHFIMICPLHETIQQTYISQYWIERSPVKFVYILSFKSETVIKRLAMYIHIMLSNYIKNLWVFFLKLCI